MSQHNTPSENIESANTTPLDARELIETAATYLDRAGEGTPEHSALGMELDGQGLGLSENVIIDAYTPSARLSSLAAEAEKALGSLAVSAAELEEALAEKQETFQQNDDQWGEMTPHLEALLAEGHPNIRLKTAGKYNPDGRRIILIRTRAGDGGWEPAAIDEGEKASEQWRKAGLDYPFQEQRGNQRARDVLSNIEKRLESHASSSGRSTVTEALAQHRKLTRQLEETQEAIKQLVPVIRENNLEESEIQVREYRDALQHDPSATGALKIRKALIDLVLKAISADNQVDTQHPDYLPFARTASLIELGIGRSDSKGDIEKDADRLVQAAGIARALLSHLHDDSTGRELRPVLERALTMAEGDTPD